MSTDRIGTPEHVAYARPGYIVCCVCGERPWAPDDIAPVFIDDPIESAMKPGDRCAECGDLFLVPDGEGEE